MSSFCVYRFFDENADLLYVGCSKNVLTRIGGHNHKSWAKDISMIYISRFDTKIDAELYERETIENESPKHNIIYNGLDHPIIGAHSLNRQRNEERRRYTQQKISNFISGKDIRRIAKESIFSESDLINYSEGRIAPRDYRAYHLHILTNGEFNIRDVYPKSYYIKQLDKEGL